MVIIMKKVTALLALIILCCQFNFSNVLAAEFDMSDQQETVLYNDLVEYVQSDYVSEMIKEHIDFTKSGMQSVYIGEGLMLCISFQTSEEGTTICSNSIMAVTATKYTKTGSASGYFYLISNNEKVAEYSLSATFEYNNSTVSKKNSNRLEDSLLSNWRIDGLTEFYDTDTQYIVSGSWTIYNKDGWPWSSYVYNNNSHIDIICTPQGTITYNMK